MTFKSGSQLEAERAGYSVSAVRIGYIINRDDNGPIPKDPVTGNPIAFEKQENAWLAAWMFDLGIHS